MKCVTVFYNIATDDEVMAILADCGVAEYTKFPRCQGRGNVSGARSDDHVWPGFNVTLILVVEDPTAPILMTALQQNGRHCAGRIHPGRSFALSRGGTGPCASRRRRPCLPSGR